MSHSNVSRLQRILLLSFLILTATSVAAAQAKSKKMSRLADPAMSNTAVQPQLLNADTSPTLRYPIARAGLTVTSVSYGWLDITHAGIRFTVVQPPNKMDDAFNAATADIRDLKLEERNNTITFRNGNKRNSIFYVPQENWGNAHGGRAFLAATEEGASGTQSIYKTMLDFEAMLALVKSATAPPAPVVTSPPPEPKPAAPPAPPAIMVASPSGAGANQTVEVSESPLVIRGVAMDGTSIPVVSINGSPANMRAQNPQAAEFWSDPLPLQPGATPIQIIAFNSAHVQTTVAFTVHYTPKAAPVDPKALDKAEIISLLQGSVSPAHVAEIVKQRGIKFNPTADDLNEIRAAGGSDDVIQAIQQAAAPK